MRLLCRLTVRSAGQAGKVVRQILAACWTGNRRLAGCCAFAVLGFYRRRHRFIARAFFVPVGRAAGNLRVTFGVGLWFGASAAVSAAWWLDSGGLGAIESGGRRTLVYCVRIRSIFGVFSRWTFLCVIALVGGPRWCGFGGLLPGVCRVWYCGAELTAVGLLAIVGGPERSRTRRSADVQTGSTGSRLGLTGDGRALVDYSWVSVVARAAYLFGRSLLRPSFAVGHVRHVLRLCCWATGS
jgi:hypothetical protein